MKNYSKSGVEGMIKFAVGIAVVIFSTYCGRMFAMKYKLRKIFFADMYAFNVRLLEEISYAKRPLEDFCRRYMTNRLFGMLLKDLLEHRARRKSLDIDLGEYTFLLGDEKQFVQEYVAAIGRADSQSQKAYFLQAGNRLQSLKTKGEEECKSRTDLYTKLGFLAGLAVLIIVV